MAKRYESGIDAHGRPAVIDTDRELYQVVLTGHMVFDTHDTRITSQKIVDRVVRLLNQEE